ncbi:MAG: hypothetical protein ABIR98_08550 [Usitatibacter sp.]
MIGSLGAGVGIACAGQAAGSVKVETVGTISPKHAAAYVVRNSRNARTTRVEILLSDSPVDATAVHAALDPHLSAINLEGLKGRDYVLLWVEANGTVTMNATFGQTMTQMLNDTNGGLEAELSANTPSRVEGRVFSPRPVKTLSGTTYSVDLKFAAAVPAPIAGRALPAGGGDPGKAFTALLAAVAKKNWPGIRAASSPVALKMFEAGYNTPAENAATAADLLRAWLPAKKLNVAGGQLRGDIALLDVEGEIFEGQRGLSLVQMVKTGTAWQFERAARAGMLP